MLTKDLEQNFEEIDAAVFSGDSLHTSNNIRNVMYYIDRWHTELQAVKLSLLDAEIAILKAEIYSMRQGL